MEEGPQEIRYGDHDSDLESFGVARDAPLDEAGESVDEADVWRASGSLLEQQRLNRGKLVAPLLYRETFARDVVCIDSTLISGRPNADHTAERSRFLEKGQKI